MFKKNLALVSEKLTEDVVNHKFYGICGSIYLINFLAFLIGFAFKLNTLPILFCATIAGIITLFFFYPKLNERKQRVAFFFLQSYPIILVSGFLGIPILRAARTFTQEHGGAGGNLSILAIITTLLTIACFVAFYFSSKGSEKIAEIKESMKNGFTTTENKIEKSGDVILCTDKETGKPEIWPYKDRFLHMLILGPTGSGKTSQTILPLINQDMQNLDAGITVLEPKGDLAQKAAMMAEYYGRPSVYFDPSFKNCPHFNPLFGKEADVVENMATTFRMLNPDSPQFFLDLNEQLVRNAIKVLKRLDKNEGVDGRHATLINLSRLLQNSGGIGRKMVVEFSQITSKTQEEAKENADIASWFLNDYLSERSKVYENTSGVRSQVSKLVSNEYLRAVLNPDFDKGERNQIDFDKHLAEGGVICISTAQGVLRDLGRFLGYFIILQLQSAVFRRPGNEDTRRPHFLYIDEFQTYSNPGFSDMLTQGRSYRVASHLATQARAQMAMGGGRDGKNFVELVSTNARNIVLYPGCSKDDAEYYSKQFGEYEKTEIQIGKSYKTFNLLTGGLDRLGHPTETVREAKKMTAIFSPSDLIYRPFGEIIYCIIKKNSIQIPKVGTISYIPKDLNDKLDAMIQEFVENNLITGEDETPMKNEVIMDQPTPEQKNGVVFEDPAAEDLGETASVVQHQPSEKAEETGFREEVSMHERPTDHLEDNDFSIHASMSDPVSPAPKEDSFENTYFDDCMDDAENDFLL